LRIFEDFDDVTQTVLATHDERDKRNLENCLPKYLYIFSMLEESGNQNRALQKSRAFFAYHRSTYLFIQIIITRSTKLFFCNRISVNKATGRTMSKKPVLVDLFGGSPYNAACRVVAETENTDVITGVNVPMLLEVLDAREETNDVSELVQVAKNSGINGIKIFSELFSADAVDDDNDSDELDL